MYFIIKAIPSWAIKYSVLTTSKRIRILHLAECYWIRKVLIYILSMWTVLWLCWDLYWELTFQSILNSFFFLGSNVPLRGQRKPMLEAPLNILKAARNIQFSRTGLSWYFMSIKLTNIITLWVRNSYKSILIWLSLNIYSSKVPENSWQCSQGLAPRNKYLDGIYNTYDILLIIPGKIQSWITEPLSCIKEQHFYYC